MYRAGAGWWQSAWLAPFALGLLVGCGRTSGRAGAAGATDVGSDADQALVPPLLQKPQVSRYFVVDDDAAGPELVVFDDPEAPRVVGLGRAEGSYSRWLTRWSPSGRRLAYALTAKQLGITPNWLMLADLASDFAPRTVEHPALANFAHGLWWVGDRAVMVVTARYSDAPDARGYYDARYLWVDADSGAVTDLGELPQSAADPESASVAPTQTGALYLDRDCNLTYLEQPGRLQTVLKDCNAQAEWSGDGSFALVTMAAGRALYELKNGQLQRATAISAELASFQGAHFGWAPGAPRFVLFEGGDAPDSRISALAVGDARQAQLTTFASVPPANHASFVSDELLVAEDWSGDKYVLNVATLASGAAPELLPLGLGAQPGDMLTATSDSSRLYYPRDPLLELRLTAGRPGERETLFDEPHPVAQVLFRLLASDDAGLLTTVEPERGRDALASAVHHQYLLGLGQQRGVVSLGSFVRAVGTDAPGIDTFQSAPQFGGIFYVGPSAHGYYVDWLGFDDISRKVRLLEFQSNLIGVDFPDTIDGNHP